MVYPTKIRVFGIVMIPDGRVKHLLRKSPGANARARAIGTCARAATTIEARKNCFKGHSIKGP